MDQMDQYQIMDETVDQDQIKAILNNQLIQLSPNIREACDGGLEGLDLLYDRIH